MNNITSPAYAGGAVAFGILMSGIVSDALSSQPLWIRLLVTAAAAGLLAAAFVFVASRFKRS